MQSGRFPQAILRIVLSGLLGGIAAPRLPRRHGEIRRFRIRFVAASAGVWIRDRLSTRPVEMPGGRPFGVVLIHAVGPLSSSRNRGAKRWSPPSPAGFELRRRKTRWDDGFHLGQL